MRMDARISLLGFLPTTSYPTQHLILTSRTVSMPFPPDAVRPRSAPIPTEEPAPAPEPTPEPVSPSEIYTVSLLLFAGNMYTAFESGWIKFLRLDAALGDRCSSVLGGGDKPSGGASCTFSLG